MPVLLRLILGLTLAALIGGVPGGARAELLITPKRVVLDDKSRDATFRLVNTSSVTQSYELIWRQLRMDEQGGLIEARDGAPGGVNRLVMVSPMRVTLEPGGRQTVRIIPRLPDGLPEGEYMSHLTFRPTGSTQPGGGSGAPGAAMQLKVRVGFSVPVILRHGPLDGSATIRPVGIDAQNNRLTLELRRQGSVSIFGDVAIYWGQPGQDGIEVGRLDGVAIYANLTRRLSAVPLTPPAGVTIGPGMLLVRYMDPDTRDVLAESTVRLE